MVLKLYQEQFGREDLVLVMSISIQSIIGVLYFLEHPPTGSAYDIELCKDGLSQFLVDLMTCSLEHINGLLGDVLEDIEEQGMMIDTTESNQWERFLPVLKLIIRFLASDLFQSCQKANISALFKNLGSIATKISRLQKDVYPRFQTNVQPWFLEDIALKGYAPLEGTWFTQQELLDQSQWNHFDMIRMRCHQFMIGVDRVCEIKPPLLYQHHTTDGIQYTTKPNLEFTTPGKPDLFQHTSSIGNADIWKSPSVGTPASFTSRLVNQSPSFSPSRITPSRITPSKISNFTPSMPGFASITPSKIIPLQQPSPSIGHTFTTPSGDIPHVTPSSLTPIQLLPTPSRKGKENMLPSDMDLDPFASANDELDTLSFLGLGSPPASARAIPSTSVKYSSKDAQPPPLTRPPGLEQVDTLKQYRETIKQYRSESKLFAKLSTHQRDMVMPLWEDVLPIFPPKESRNWKG